MSKWSRSCAVIICACEELLLRGCCAAVENNTQLTDFVWLEKVESQAARPNLSPELSGEIRPKR